MKNAHAHRVRLILASLGTLSVGVLISASPLRGQVVGVAVCGNGQLTEYEECDDGNQTGGDGCSAACVSENKPDGVRGLQWRSWQLPQRITNYAVAPALGKLWLIGGRHSLGYLSNDVYSRDPANSHWEQAGVFPEAVLGASAIEWNGELWVIGGTTCLPYYPHTCTTMRTTYHTSNGTTWIPGPMLPANVSPFHTPLHVFNGKLFIELQIPYVLSSGAGSWQSAGTSLGGNGIDFGGKLLMLNGRTVKSSTDGGSNWRTESILPIAPAGLPAATLVRHSNYLLVLANARATPAGTNLNCYKALLSSSDALHWSKESSTECFLPQRTQAKVLVFNGSLWVFTDPVQNSQSQGDIHSAALPPFFPGCGNNTVNEGEECDDGNQVNTDACTNACKNPACGDTFVQQGEECDDGNQNNRDACTTDCRIPACGDGRREGTEQCDDDNQTDGDGCSATCTNEMGFSCEGEPLSVCTRLCGNGRMAGGEQCDDGDRESGDGCSATCTVESGHICRGTVPSVCWPIVCGNGGIEPGEECDDGNTSDTEGWCSADCKNPRNLTCTAPANAVISFTQSVVDAERSDQVVAADLDGNGLLDLALRKGVTIKLLKRNANAFTQVFSRRFTRPGFNPVVEDPNDRGYIEAFDVPRGQPGKLVALIQSSMYPNLSNSSPGYHENNHYILGMAANTGIVGSSGLPRTASRAGERFALTSPNGFLGSVYRGTTATTAYQPLEFVDNLSVANSTRRTVLLNGQALYAFTSISRGLIDGKHVIATTRLLMDDTGTVLYTFPTNEVPAEVEVGDVSGDGRTDIVAILQNGKVQWFNPANNTWFFITEASWVRSGLAVTDVDGDGDKDVVVQSNSTTTGSVRWMEQRIGGQWAAHLIHEGTVNDMNAADLNGDGRPDIVIATPTGTVLYTQVQECVTPSVCGNGTKEQNEACDDGNTSTTVDGCSALCVVDQGYSCTGAPRSTCTLNCGNGVINTGESCDDGGAVSGNGCSATCTTEPGYFCTGTPSVCARFCGNGQINTGESCDDGNDNPADGCTADCAITPGFGCAGSPSVCTQNCGNGTVQGNVGELCDDGNITGGDGCSATCTKEYGFGCVGTAPSVCTRLCGNGRIDTSTYESCDDGNTVNADGCTSICQIPSGYSCTGTPSVCVFQCGNGTVQAEYGETCDDRNTAANDGCDPLCHTTPGYTCTGTPSVCSVSSLCRNGVLNTGEQCDDGNTIDGDGCNNNCRFAASSSQTSSQSSATSVASSNVSSGVASSSTASTVTASPCLLNRLVSHWKLDEPSRPGPQLRPHVDSHGSVTLFEETSDANGITPMPGNINGAVGLEKGERLRGESPSLSLGDAQTSGFTFALWAYPIPSMNQSYLQGIAEKPGEFNLTMTNTHFIFTVVNGTQTASVMTPITAINGNYKYSLITAWMDPQVGQIGIQVGRSDQSLGTPATAAWTGGVGSTAQPLKIGFVTGQPQFGGGVDSISLWKRALTSEERRKLFAFGAGLDYASFSRVCSATPICGDVTVQAGEQCDEGATTDTGRCTSGCRYGVCMDGNVRNGVEECDDGNALNTDTCTAQCRRAFCGDAFIQPGEQCDDGNTNTTDACTRTCQVARCGDGSARTGVEQCDDGNTVNNDGCDAGCRFEPMTRERCLQNINKLWDLARGCIDKIRCYEYNRQTCPSRMLNSKPCKVAGQSCTDDFSRIGPGDGKPCSQLNAQRCGNIGSEGRLCVWTGASCVAVNYQDRCLVIRDNTQCQQNDLCNFGKIRSSQTYFGYPYCSEKFTCSGIRTQANCTDGLRANIYARCRWNVEANRCDQIPYGQ